MWTFPDKVMWVLRTLVTEKMLADTGSKSSFRIPNLWFKDRNKLLRTIWCGVLEGWFEDADHVKYVCGRLICHLRVVVTHLGMISLRASESQQPLYYAVGGRALLCPVVGNGRPWALWTHVMRKSHVVFLSKHRSGLRENLHFSLLPRDIYWGQHQKTK